MNQAIPASNDPVALDAALLWRDDVLAIRHLAARGAVLAGEGPGALGPIPGEGFAFARLDRGAAWASIPVGAVATLRRAGASHEVVHGPAEVRLHRGDTLDLPVGALTLRASAVAPVSLVPDAGGGARGGSALLHVGLAAAIHLVVLGLSMQAAQASVPEDEVEQASTARDLLIRIEERDHAADQPLFTIGGEGETQGNAAPRAGDGRAGGGQKAAGAEGKMGDREAAARSRGRYAVPERRKKDPDPSLARDEAMHDAAQFGMIGLLAQGALTPSAPWSADVEAHGNDAIAARGAMWGTTMGESRGLEGLGLSGIGEGGGGRGEGIGLGTIGALGHLDGAPGAGTGGDGSTIRGVSGGSWGDVGVGVGGGLGRVGGSHRTRPPICRCGDYTSVTGHLPPEAVQRVIRQNFGRFRFCYEKALDHNPTLAGRVSTRFVIGRDGAVSSVADGGSDLADASVVSCVERAFYGLSFPQPEGGIVTVTYPLVFSPAE